MTDGDHVAFGGGGLVRKPMALAAARGASAGTGLDLAALLGGPEADARVGLDRVASLGPVPNLRVARESWVLRVTEMSECSVFEGLVEIRLPTPALSCLWRGVTDAAGLVRACR
ncbi:hypothetical protein OHA74_54475 [Streptomyces phaeochromogenes]|uniref:hypothetical protein n=1 Tax=Streptomyces phaeochromogenes TaxID=1923 RepID=UPI002E27D47B|nr:hypothetical protein [Streptomyces phaeochromogenes]